MTNGKKIRCAISFFFLFFVPFLLLPNETVMDFHDYLARFIFLCSILLAKVFLLQFVRCLLRHTATKPPLPSTTSIRSNQSQQITMLNLTPKWIGLCRWMWAVFCVRCSQQLRHPDMAKNEKVGSMGVYGRKSAREKKTQRKK